MAENQIDAILAKRFKHIIEQEKWVFTETKPKLKGGGQQRPDILLLMSIIVLLGSIGIICYLRLPCFQR